MIVFVTAWAERGHDALEGGLRVLAALLGILYLVVEPARVLREVRWAGVTAPDPEAVGG